LKNFKHKKHLFFDLDHTLWDFDKNSAYAFETIFKQQGFTISLFDFLIKYRIWIMTKTEQVNFLTQFKVVLTLNVP
jgi:FMN phosphatase YigB (HAD superfamily)